MTTDDLNELHGDLTRRADHYKRVAAQRALFGDGVDGAADDGKAQAYRHAAELLRAAEDRAVRAAAERVAR